MSLDFDPLINSVGELTGPACKFIEAQAKLELSHVEIALPYSHMLGNAVKSEDYWRKKGDTSLADLRRSISNLQGVDADEAHNELGGIISGDEEVLRMPHLVRAIQGIFIDHHLHTSMEADSTAREVLEKESVHVVIVDDASLDGQLPLDAVVSTFGRVVLVSLLQLHRTFGAGAPFMEVRGVFAEAFQNMNFDSDFKRPGPMHYIEINDEIPGLTHTGISTWLSDEQMEAHEEEHEDDKGLVIELAKASLLSMSVFAKESPDWSY